MRRRGAPAPIGPDGGAAATRLLTIPSAARRRPADGLRRGAACDFARAFVEADRHPLEGVVATLPGAEYQAFLAALAAQMDALRPEDPRSRGGPVLIESCSDLGRISRNGPSPFARAALGCEEIGFVDVAVLGPMPLTLWPGPPA
jgi:hypothetical protein